MANLFLTEALIVSVVYLAYRLFKLFNQRSSKLPKLPPGPRPIPIIGNLFDLPGRNDIEYKHWHEHKKYGPISSVTAMNQTIVVIHDRHAAIEILEKKALKTAGRPKMDFLSFSGYGNFTPVLQHNIVLRNQRKLVHQLLGTKQIASKFLDSQEAEARRFLVRVLAEPNRIREHFASESGAVILKIIYGYTTEPHQPDLLVALIEQMIDNFNIASAPFSRAFDFWPALFKLLPEGLPGTGFRETARQHQKLLRAVVNMPYEFVQKQMEDGVNAPSYVSTLIESAKAEKSKDGQSDQGEEDRKYSAATMYLAAVDTTLSVLCSFLLAMVLHPEVQRKAQEEIDRVTDSATQLRLPGHDDLPHMPYVQALASEALRWGPVLSMGFPHRALEDIVYEDTLIPKDAIILTDNWGFAHDSETHPDPETFDPERFLSRNEPDPRDFVFGFGRRICPGRHLADLTIQLTIMHLLSMYNIGKAVDENGNEITPEKEYKNGLISHLKSFPFTITPRSEKHRQMVEDIERDYPWEESNKSQLNWRYLKEKDVLNRMHAA